MPKVILIGYEIKIKKKREQGYKPLAEFNGVNDFYQVIVDYLTTHQPKNTGKPNAFKVKQADLKTIGFDGFIKDDTKRTIFGTVKIGEFGLSYEMVNVENQNLEHMRSVNETDSFPIHFLLKVPDVNDVLRFSGVAVFEKFRGRGAKGLFESHFMETFKTVYPDYTLIMNPLVPEEILTSLDKGKISEVTLKSPKLPKNIEDYYSRGNEETERANITYKFSKVGADKKMNNYLKGVVNKAKPMNGVLVGDWFDVNEIDAKLKIDGKDETIIIKEEKEQIIPGLDISKKAKPAKNGFPPPNKVQNESLVYLKELEVRLRRDLT